MKKSMKRTTLTTVALVLGMSLPAPLQAESLREALATAYISNPDLLAARARQRQVDEAVSQAVSQWRPTVTGQVQVGHLRSENVASLDTGRVVSDSVAKGFNENYQATLNQNLFRGFQNFNQFEGAKAEVKAGRFNLLDTEQQVLLQAVTAYMDVLRDEAVVRLNNNNIRVLQRQLEATQDRFQVGEVTRTDVAQSEAALAGAQAQLARAEATLQQSRSTYRQVIGNFPGTLEDTPSLPPLPVNEEEAAAIALEENPIVMAARFNEKAADYDIREAKGALLPTLSGNVSVSKATGPAGNQFDPVTGQFADVSSTRENLTAGLTLSIPLYQSGAEYSNIRRAKQVRSERLMQIRGAERQVMRDVRVAWQNYRASQSSIESTRAQVRANEIALDGVRQEARVGSRTTLDVLEAEQTLLNARVDLVTANRDSYVAGFGVLQSVGRLNAKSLDLPVDLYDVTRYYDHVKWKFIGWGDDGIGNDPG